MRVSDRKDQGKFAHNLRRENNLSVPQNQHGYSFVNDTCTSIQIRILGINLSIQFIKLLSLNLMVNLWATIVQSIPTILAMIRTV